MRFYVDEQLSHSQSLDLSFGSIYKSNRSPFDKRFHFILNLAIGGNFFGGNYGSQDIGRVSPGWTQPFQIDWVRIYRDASKDPVEPVYPPFASPLADVLPLEPVIVMPLQPLEIGVAADTFAWGGPFENSTFGTSSILYVRGEDNRVAYLRFDLNFQAINIESATLQLFGKADDSFRNDSVVVNVHSVDKTTWRESSLAWCNKPAIDEAIIDSVGVPASPGAF
jgi:hypothetical protein